MKHSRLNSITPIIPHNIDHLTKIRFCVNQMQNQSWKVKLTSPIIRYNKSSLSSRINARSSVNLRSKLTPNRISTSRCSHKRKSLSKIIEAKLKDFNTGTSSKSELGTQLIDKSTNLQQNQIIFNQPFFSFKRIDGFSLSSSPRSLLSHWCPKVSIISKPQPMPQERPKKDESVRHRMLGILAKMNQLHLKPKDFLISKIISTEPYEKSFSKELIKAIKAGENDIASKLLSHNKFLVHDFDYSNKTALHWAVMRKNYEGIELLIKYDSDVDRKDGLKRVPLYYAAYNNDIRSCEVIYLLDAAGCRS